MEAAFLTPLYRRPGPWASVYLDTSRSTETARQQQQMRDRAAARQLAQQGADTRTCEAVLDQLSHEPASNAPPGRALFATEGEVVLDVPLAYSPATVETSWAVLPHTAPLLGRLGERRCLVACIDTTGADLELHDLREHRTLGQAEGEQWQGRGHRSLPADRWEWHYQRRVEDTWHDTADTIADEIARHWAESGAQLLVLTGGVRERRAVHQRLPQQLLDVTVEVDSGGRSAGIKREVLDERIAQAWAKYAREHLDAVLDTFRTGRGRPGEHGPGGPDTSPGQAAEGVPAVVEAARKHQLAALLIQEGGADLERNVWIGPEPEQIAVRRNEARAMGAAEPLQAHADDALIRAATAAHAEILHVPEGTVGPAGGVGAVLRWTD